MIDGVAQRLRASGPVWLATRIARRALAVAGIEWTRVLVYRTTRIPPPPGVEVERITHPADPRLPEEDPLLDIDLAVERLLAGDELFVVRAADGTLASRGWVRHGRPILVTEVAHVLPLADDEAWVFDCETSPSQRGRGLFPALLAAAARAHLEDGGAVLVGVLDWNRASVRAICKAGYQRDRVIARGRLRGHTVLSLD